MEKEQEKRVRRKRNKQPIHDGTNADSYRKKYTVDGITDTLSNLCDLYGKDLNTVWYRIHRSGWDPKNALTVPICNSNPACDIHEYMNTIGNYNDFDRAIGFKEGTISSRIRKQGMAFEEAISTPLRTKGTMTNAVFFMDPKTRKPINQFSDLIDAEQYKKDLKVFNDLMKDN